MQSVLSLMIRECLLIFVDILFIFRLCYLTRRTMILFYFVLFWINIDCLVSELNSCRQKFGSNNYDLNRLSHLTMTGEQSPYRYALTPCGLVPTDQCGSPSIRPFEAGMTACQEQVFGSGTPLFESPMGFLDGYAKEPNIAFSENTAGPGTGVIMTISNALCSGMKRLVNVTFTCDKSVSNPTTMEVVENPPCTFNIRIKAAGACPVAATGITGGAVFIIILVVVITVYVVGGVLYNKIKENQKGLGLLPHPSFWLFLVGLFLNGCRFSLTFIRTCGKGSSTMNYNSV